MTNPLFWTLGLFAVGVVLILAEFFLPGMVLGILGVVAFVASTWVGCYYYPEYAFFIILGEFIGAVFVVLLGMYLLPKTRAGKRLVLSSNQEGFTANTADASLLGQTGVAVTMLRPAGVVRVGEQRLDAVSSGDVIDAGAPVRVIEASGLRVVVEKITD